MNQQEPSGNNQPQVVIVGSPEEGKSVMNMVEQPAKVMRIGTMIKQLLDEVKEAPLDEAGRESLARIHRSSLDELKEGLAPELVAELERLSLPFESAETPTGPELRIAQAQLVGWLEGLFHGIQAAVYQQQAVAQAQLQQMRQALPRTTGGANPEAGPPNPGGTGQYL